MRCFGRCVPFGPSLAAGTFGEDHLGAHFVLFSLSRLRSTAWLRMSACEGGWAMTGKGPERGMFDERRCCEADVEGESLVRAYLILGDELES